MAALSRTKVFRKFVFQYVCKAPPKHHRYVIRCELPCLVLPFELIIYLYPVAWADQSTGTDNISYRDLYSPEVGIYSPEVGIYSPETGIHEQKTSTAAYTQNT